MNANKRLLGQYYTQCNPFANDGFFEWAHISKLKNKVILEPFAGSNNLIHMLQDINFCNQFISFDILPKNNQVNFKDTLDNFPKNYDTCITNPPYLAKNSAKRRGLNYPNTKYDDLYKFALDKCLVNCEYVGAIIPASFLNSRLFRDRLSHYILLNNKMFDDTYHPVCLALFTEKSEIIKVYENNKYLGLLSDFEKKLPDSKLQIDMKFNDKEGQLGLIAIDNTIKPSIRFCKGQEINPNKIKFSSRSITRIAIDTDVNKIISYLNENLISFRQSTYDLFLTPFKGLRKDNKYRRRLDFALARNLINQTISMI